MSRSAASKRIRDDAGGLDGEVAVEELAKEELVAVAVRLAAERLQVVDQAEHLRRRRRHR